jgi:hypothetical protein
MVRAAAEMAIALIRTARHLRQGGRGFRHAIAGIGRQVLRLSAALGVSPFVDLDLKRPGAGAELARATSSSPPTVHHGGWRATAGPASWCGPISHEGAIVGYGWVFATPPTSAAAPELDSPASASCSRKGDHPATKLVAPGSSTRSSQVYTRNCARGRQYPGPGAMLAALTVGASAPRSDRAARHCGLPRAQRDLAAYAAERARGPARPPDGTMNLGLSRRRLRPRIPVASVRDDGYATAASSRYAARSAGRGGYTCDGRHAASWVTVKLDDLICSLDKTAPSNQGSTRSPSRRRRAPWSTPSFAACGVRHAGGDPHMDACSAR